MRKEANWGGASGCGRMKVRVKLGLWWVGGLAEGLLGHDEERMLG